MNYISNIYSIHHYLCHQELTMDVSVTPFHVTHQGLNDKDFQVALETAYLSLCPSLHYISPHMISLDDNLKDSILRNNMKGNIMITTTTTTTTASTNSTADSATNSTNDTNVNPMDEIPSDPLPLLRLGLLSAHFYDHSIGRALIEMIMFIYMKSLKPDDFNTSYFSRMYSGIILYVYLVDRSYEVNEGGSIAGRNDLITQTLSSNLKNNFIRLPHNISLIREVLVSHRLDVLVFADLGMDFTSYAIAMGRLATIQVISYNFLIYLIK